MISISQGLWPAAVFRSGAGGLPHRLYTVLVSHVAEFQGFFKFFKNFLARFRIAYIEYSYRAQSNFRGFFIFQKFSTRHLPKKEKPLPVGSGSF